MFSSNTYCFSITLSIAIVISGYNSGMAQDVAFPGAEGYGKYATGGRGGEVIYVTNLNDNGPGSLRNAIEQEGARTIVFSISGDIKLNSPLIVNEGDVTIAGQTAPGDGITVRDYPFELESHNIIVRYMRFRLGDIHKVEGDAFSATGVKNVIIDHCSMSWGIDEVSSFYRNKNFTLQWSLIAESLADSYHHKGRHGYGGIWGGQQATFHHNLIANHSSRTPRLADSDPDDNPTNRKFDFYNNVIYNWEFNNVYGGEKGEHNLVNNYYKDGPATNHDVANRIVNPSHPYGKFYIQGNVVEGFEDVIANNWAGGIQTDDPAATRSKEPFDFNAKVTKAKVAMVQVLANAGANKYRDEVDQRIVKEVKTGTASYRGSKGNLPGIIDSQEDVGGWPELHSKKAPKDTDRDGMPDEWEIDHDLDPDFPDNNGIDLHAYYTNLEVYINSLVDLPNLKSLEE